MILPRAPVSSITSISYIDSAGDAQTLDSSYYSIDDYDPWPSIKPAYGMTYPTHQDIHNAITVTYVAGYGSERGSVPNDIREALLIIVGNWIRYQSVNESGTLPSTVPYAAKQLLDNYRRLRI